MAIIFKSRTEEQENYAIAVPTNGPLMIIQTYHNIEQLEIGYKHWRNLAEQRGTTKPVPIQRIEGDQWKILEDIISDFLSLN